MTPEQFKEARRALGLDQKTAAQMLGYGAAPRISELERGPRIPETTARLMQAYLDGYRPPDWPI